MSIFDKPIVYNSDILLKAGSAQAGQRILKIRLRLDSVGETVPYTPGWQAFGDGSCPVKKLKTDITTKGTKITKGKRPLAAMKAKYPQQKTE